MTQAKKQHRVTVCMVIFAVIMLSLIAFVSVLMFMPKQVPQKNIQTDHVSAQARNLNSRWNKLQHQDYITFDQFNNLFSCANVTRDQALIKKMNLTHIVDNANGRVYCVHIEKQKKGYSYTLTPVQSSKGATINPYWLNRRQNK